MAGPRFSAGVLTVAGVLSDRIGRKPVLLTALALGIVACVLFATAGSVLVLAVARFLTGLAVGGAVAGALAFVMFLGATGVQFAVRGLPVRAIPPAGAASTTAGMVALVVSLQTSSPALLAVAAVLAGTGHASSAASP
ncbi:MFS transporter [Amycolatopsis methanolica]|uniref:MFS transporter n=1 Tax=Amycolatopsis methanolica TaxID=1814 RepID=UPI003427955E